MTDHEDVAMLPATWNPENELNILAAIVAGRNPTRLPITPADFYEPLHEHLYQLLTNIQQSGATPDAMILHAKLNPGNHIDLRAIRIIPDLVTRGSTPNLEILADELIESRRIRDIQTITVKTLQAIHDGRKADDIAAAITHDLKQHTPTANTQTLAQIMPAVIQRIQDGQLRGASTPWADVDHYTNGARPGELTIIAGRPGMGKSLSAQNWATHVTQHHKHHILFVSMEMLALQIGQRIVADVTSIEQNNLMNPKAMEQSGRWDKIQNRMNRLTDHRFHIAAGAKQTLAQISRNANALNTRHPLGLIVVDYIQLITPADTRNANREQQVGAFSRGLKELSLELNTHVVALSQFSRQAGSRNNGPPILSDLRESGSLEQDADNVIGLHLPDPEAKSLGEMHILKARQGELGVVNVHMATEFARIGSRTRGSLS